MASEDLTLRMRALGARGTERDADRVARAIDNVGDQASQASRKLSRFNAESSKTRVSLGPFSTSMRFAAFAVGGFILAAEKAVPFTLALAEGLGTAGAAAGGAGLAGFTAFKQATLVTKLGVSDLTAALGGNKQAFQRLTPAARRLFGDLATAQAKMKDNAGRGIFPGLTAGTRAALKNLPVFNRIINQTGKTLGGLARTAGGRLGSKSWGADLADIGKQNTVVIRNLGRAGIHLAGGFKDIVHEAEPLAVWLSQAALRGSKVTETWLGNARASGRMARFFREGRRDLTLLASITGHLVGGVFNLFGASDVNGTRTLANLDRLTAHFERWTRLITDVPLGPELEKQMALALGALASFVGRHIADAGVTAAGAFWKAFWSADVWGKGITALFLASKFGLTGKVLKSLVALILGGGGGGGKGGAGSLLARGATPTNPLFVVDVTSQWRPGKGPTPVPTGGGGKGGILRRAGRIAAYAGTAAAAVAGTQAVITGKIPGWVPLLGGKSLTDPIIGGRGKQDVVSANTRAYQGYQGIPANAQDARRMSLIDALPKTIVIHNQLVLADGKVLATNVKRQSLKAKSIR